MRGDQIQEKLNQTYSSYRKNC